MASTLKCDTIQNASSATANLTLDAAGNATVGNTLVMGSSFKRNRIINGNLSVWQRGTTGSLSSYGYVADRWAGGQFNTQTMARSTSVPSTAGSIFQYSLQAQRPNGATNTGLISAVQIIESVNIYDLAGQTVTLSFWAKAGANFSAASSLLGIQIQTGTVADQGGAYPYYSWTGVAQPVNTTQAITTTWTKYTFTGTLGSGVLEAAVVFYFTPVGTAGADDSFYITGVQLEVGSVATPYERQIYSDQLAQCQRYYWIDRGWPDNTATARFYSGGAYSTTQSEFVVRHPVTMRSGPTLSASAASTFAIYLNATYTTPTAIQIYAASVNYALIYTANPSVAAGLSANLASNPSSTTTFLSYSAEL